MARPHAVVPRPIIANAIDKGRVGEEPVKGSVPAGGATTVVGAPCGVSGVTAVDVVVDPRGPTGIDEVVSGEIVMVVVGRGNVVVVAGTLVVVVGRVVDSPTVVVVLVGDVQSDNCCVSVAEPCGWPKKDQVVAAWTVCGPEPLSTILTTSLAEVAWNVKIRTRPGWPSMSIDSLAVTAVFGNSE